MENSPRFNIEEHDYQTEGQKYVWCKGVRFARDEKTGYYLNSSNHVRLHVFVWEQANCKVPKGYHVHHINGDKNDNRVMNLRLMSGREHLLLHGHNLTEEQREWYRNNLAEKARPKASDWHRSEEGRKWHSAHAKEMYANGDFKKREKVCDVCGEKFMTYDADAKFCSPKCRAKHRRIIGADNEKRICEWCGKEFEVSRFRKKGNGRFCGRHCAMMWVAQKKAKARSENGTTKQLSLGI